MAVYRYTIYNFVAQVSILYKVRIIIFKVCPLERDIKLNLYSAEVHREMNLSYAP